MSNLPVYKLQEAQEYGVLDGLSIIGTDEYRIFYSLDESIKSKSGSIITGFVGKRRFDEEKIYLTFDSAMSDVQKIIGGKPRIITIIPHDNPGAEFQLEMMYQQPHQEFNLEMSERDLP